jgi:hypothetical protein
MKKSGELANEGKKSFEGGKWWIAGMAAMGIAACAFIPATVSAVDETPSRHEQEQPAPDTTDVIDSTTTTIITTTTEVVATGCPPVPDPNHPGQALPLDDECNIIPTSPISPATLPPTL